jgi:hypothetical protein
MSAVACPLVARGQRSSEEKDDHCLDGNVDTRCSKPSGTRSLPSWRPPLRPERRRRRRRQRTRAQIVELGDVQNAIDDFWAAEYERRKR